MTASIGGQAWSSTTSGMNAQVGGFGIIQIQGYQNGTTILLTLYNIDSTGTFQLGMAGTMVGGGAIVADLAGHGWATPLSGTAGTITLTTLTATQIAGTFSFTADAQNGGATGTKVVTSGQFDMLLGGTLATLPDQYGNRAQGTMGGSSWIASNAVITLLGTTLVISASNASYTLGIGITSFPGVGSYAVGTAPGDALVTLMGPAVNPTGPVNCCWGTGAGTSGTLTVSSLTATRIKGTVAATLVPNAGSGASGPIAIADSFDLGIQ
jgi:hypothetical protein